MKVKREKERLALLGVEIFQRQRNQYHGYFWAHQLPNDHKVTTGKAFAAKEDCIRDAWVMLTSGGDKGTPSGALSTLSLKQIVQIDRLNLLGVTIEAVDGGEGTEWVAERPGDDGDATSQVIAQRESFNALVKETWNYLVAEAKE